MTTTWTPLRDYAANNTYHVLGAAPCYVHPNGNLYFYACEKVDGAHQNLVIYRYSRGAMAPVATFIDGTDSEGFIERGGCLIAPDGAMWVATSLQPKGVTYDPHERTGYEGVWCRIPNVDAPYTTVEALEARIALLEARLSTLLPTPGTLRLGSQNAPADGGEIQLSDGAGGFWVVDVRMGRFRVFRQEAGKLAREVLGLW